MVSFSDSFMLTEDNLSSMNSMLHRYKDVELGKKRQIRDEAMEQVRAVQHLEDRQKQILDLEKKVVWADVQAIEDDIAGRESEISQIDQTMEKIKSFDASIRGYINETVSLTLRIQKAEVMKAELQQCIQNSSTLLRVSPDGDVRV